ncbi:MAG: group II intron reverse transcriptase/maturase [Clostridiales bacterium]|jgi:group II intron reverse transcriptase/maturase|nr:group II intron reverse transcriptase/maturase [Clostridiales bacterium]
MRDSQKVLNELTRQASNKDYQFNRIYRILCNPDMYIKAYSNIYSNKGSSTCGTDNTTADGFSEERINRIIQTLKDESYQAKPVRRTYTPKKNGKTRPLGIPSFDDRLIQEVCRMVLEAIYEPVFYVNSHGFRPDKSCHTALKEIVRTFKGVNWFIEGDIKGCFDNINHQTLIAILRKRIDDERFIRLIWKFLKAGYMEDFKYNNTFSGTPQGGIVSPILANIYMHELDTYVLETLQKDISSANANKGKAKKNRNRNPVYVKLTNDMKMISNRIEACENEEERKQLISRHKDLRKQRNKEHESIGHTNCRNLQYVRYADDFIIGICTSKDDCQTVKQQVKDFLLGALNLELSEEKTLTTHSTNKARFLDYEIQVRENNRFFEDVNGVKKRTGNRGIALFMPEDAMFDYINKKDIVQDINAKQWRGKARTILQSLSDLEIVTTCNAEIRGLYNYYAMAENVAARMNMIYHMMEYSCLKTLAGKHKTSVYQIRSKLQVGEDWGVRYDTKKEKNKVRFFYNQGFTRKQTPSTDPKIDNIVNIKPIRG